MAPWLMLLMLALTSVSSSSPTTKPESGKPQIIQCRSPEMETFSCYWTTGNFPHETALEKLQLLYTKRLAEWKEWEECPDYSMSGENSCYFNASFTSIQVPYHVQLVAADHVYDERYFQVEDIVIPDPPVGLNWTVLNTNPVCFYTDIQVTWKPPPSADVRNGWILLDYQLQYKEVNETEWHELDPQSTTKIPIYALKTYKDYEIRVQAKAAPEIYGEFSEVLYVSFGPKGLVPCKEAESGKPQIIQCRSPEMETFSCYWTTGNFPHGTALGKLQLLYTKREGKQRKSGNWTLKGGIKGTGLAEWKEWEECPNYSMSGENSCYFNSSFTSVWVPYHIRLVAADHVYDERYFGVEDIVIPDPPVGLNWTVLNTSPAGLYTDIQVTWKPPPSADVQNGWILLNYQLQYKEVNETEWYELDPQSTSKIPIYALKTCKDYEIRVQAKAAPEIYGEFSEVLYVSFGPKGLVPCNEEFQIRWPLVMAFGTLGLMVMLSLVLFSKQQKLKILILPPVPVPKIKGIDPDLLKKGKLDEVNSILASHGSYMPQLYGDDSWVEFIELDIDEAEERTEGSDTDRLLDDVHMKSHGCLGVRDDDSGRASCCEPDIPETDFSASDTCDGTSDIDQSKKVRDKEDLLCLDQKDNEKPISSLDDGSVHLPSDNPTKDQDLKTHVPATEITSPPVQTQLSNQSSVVNIDFYTQVSDITPGGSVVLSPGQKIKMGKPQNEVQKEPVAQCQPSFVMDSAYFGELDVKKCVTVTPPKEDEPEVQVQSFSEDTYLATDSPIAHHVNPSTVSRAAEEKEPEGCEIPVADYTSIHMVQSPQGLVLNATALLMPDKEFIMSCGYVSTEQLNKILP